MSTAVPLTETPARFCRGRLGPVATLLLLAPILVFVWSAARAPVLSVLNGAVPSFVLSGAIFREKFNTIHAGDVLDQPTIGKWLFWFTVMAAISLPWVAAVAWLSNSRDRAARYIVAAFALLLAFALACILSWPATWLIQYVWSMGWTPRRAGGLAYATAGALIIAVFVLWALRRGSPNRPLSPFHRPRTNMLHDYHEP